MILMSDLDVHNNFWAILVEKLKVAQFEGYYHHRYYEYKAI